MALLIVLATVIGVARAMCVSAFYTHPELFEVCKSKPCIFFRTEHPFVFLDSNMRAELDQRPFACHQSKSVWPRLDGAFFDMVREMRELSDAQCVWAGPNCAFDEMIDFLAVSQSHQWIAGGLLFLLLPRMRNTSIPSTSILEDKLYVIGPPLHGHTTLTEAWNTIWHTFTERAWAFLGCCLLIHLLVRVWMCWHFRKPDRSFWGLCVRISDISDDDHWNWMNAWWLFILKLFVGVTVILWEVAIAVSVFEARQEAPLNNLPSTHFGLVRNTTMEYLFLQMGVNTSYHEFDTNPELYDALQRDSEVRYTLAYGAFNRYFMNEQREACDKLKLYDHVPPSLVKGRNPPPITGGWFYSANVPSDTRRRIDQGIVRLKQKGQIQAIVDAHAGEDLPQRCRSKSTSIDLWLVLLLLFILLGILFAGFVSNMLWYELLRCWRRLRPPELQSSEVAETLHAHNP